MSHRRRGVGVGRSGATAKYVASACPLRLVDKVFSQQVALLLLKNSVGERRKNFSRDFLVLSILLDHYLYISVVED